VAGDLAADDLAEDGLAHAACYHPAAGAAKHASGRGRARSKLAAEARRGYEEDVRLEAGVKTHALAWLVGGWLGLATLASADEATVHAVPWPRGEPSPVELDGKISDAVELYTLERAEEFLEAFEAGESSEHVFLLQDGIDAGHYDADQLFARGDGAFEHEFLRRDGYGDPAHERLVRVHDGAYGGLDGFSCAGCHGVGGVNGAGTATATAFYFGDGQRTSSAVLRNPPAVLGLGYVQQLAREMSADLRTMRERALAEAKRKGEPVTVELATKGVSFGSLTAGPDGAVDESAIAGVDADLVVKPFGWKGHTVDLRRFVERAARIHFGIQSHVLAIDNRWDPEPSLLGHGHWWDPDADGKQRELEEGTITALAVYLSLLEVPVILPPNDPALRERWARGSQLFHKLGCVECHKPALQIGRQNNDEASDTTAAPPFSYPLSVGETPRITGSQVPLFSDLKRHDMGPELADKNDNPDGIGKSVWLTRALWGLAESPPYLHDGRAATILEAVGYHGGEAAEQRAAFDALDEEGRRDLHVFLLSLTREPKLRIDR
jgi:hypothetical protein